MDIEKLASNMRFNVSAHDATLKSSNNSSNDSNKDEFSIESIQIIKKSRFRKNIDRQYNRIKSAYKSISDKTKITYENVFNNDSKISSNNGKTLEETTGIYDSLLPLYISKLAETATADESSQSSLTSNNDSKLIGRILRREGKRASF